MNLYTQLHNNPMPKINDGIYSIWHEILNDKNHNIIIGLEDSKIVSSCVLIIIPNLTHMQRPYALVENVVTDKAYRNKGYATKVLNYAKEIAQNKNCYKMMLLTGSKQDSTLKFYEKADYNRNDKIAFIQWI